MVATVMENAALEHLEHIMTRCYFPSNCVLMKCLLVQPLGDSVDSDAKPLQEYRQEIG